MKCCGSRVPPLTSPHLFRNRGTVSRISTIWRRNGSLSSRRRRRRRRMRKRVRTQEWTWIRRNPPTTRWWFSPKCQPMRRGGGRWPSSRRDEFLSRRVLVVSSSRPQITLTITTEGCSVCSVFWDPRVACSLYFRRQRQLFFRNPPRHYLLSATTHGVQIFSSFPKRSGRPRLGADAEVLSSHLTSFCS